MATENDSDIFANTESRLVLDNYCIVVIANLKPNGLFFRTHHLWYERRWGLKKKTAKNCLTLTCCFCTCNSCPMSLSLCLSACNMLSNSSILWFLNSSSSLSVSTSAWSRSNNQVTCNNPICFATAVLISLIAKLQIVEVLHRKTKPVVFTLSLSFAANSKSGK